MTSIRPFRLDVPDATLEEIRRRVAAFPWRAMPDTDGWELGTDVATMRSPCEYWLDGFDWRAQLRGAGGTEAADRGRPRVRPHAARRGRVRRIARATLRRLPSTAAETAVTQITSHVLDTSRGAPAADLLITLQQQNGDDWLMLGSAATDADGRVADFTGSEDVLPGGVYRLTFYTGDYHERLGQGAFYPHVDVAFEIAGDGQHYHVPLLLNPFGYSTYRGS